MAHALAALAAGLPKGAAPPRLSDIAFGTAMSDVALRAEARKYVRFVVTVASAARKAAFRLQSADDPAGPWQDA